MAIGSRTNSTKKPTVKISRLDTKGNRRITVRFVREGKVYTKSYVLKGSTGASSEGIKRWALNTFVKRRKKNAAKRKARQAKKATPKGTIGFAETMKGHPSTRLSNGLDIVPAITAAALANQRSLLEDRTVKELRDKLSALEAKQPPIEMIDVQGHQIPVTKKAMEALLNQGANVVTQQHKQIQQKQNELEQKEKKHKETKDKRYAERKKDIEKDIFIHTFVPVIWSELPAESKKKFPKADKTPKEPLWDELMKTKSGKTYNELQKRLRVAYDEIYHAEPESKSKVTVTKDITDEKDESVGKGFRRLLREPGGFEKLTEKDHALTNHEIDQIMQSYKSEGYLGAIPRDYLAGLPVRNERWSCVLNTDPSTKPGQHWVAIYCDPSKDKSIEYYDSYADECPKDIRQTLKALVDKMGVKDLLKFKTSSVVNQSVNSSNCGYFCCRFLQERYAGVPFWRATNFVPDKLVKNVKEGEEGIEEWKASRFASPVEKKFKYL